MKLPETNGKFAPENRPGPKRKFIFQLSIFRGYVGFRELEVFFVSIHAMGFMFLVKWSSDTGSLFFCVTTCLAEV